MSLERKLLSALSTPERIAKVWDIGLAKEHFEEAFADHIYGFIIKYWRDSELAAAPTHAQITTERPGFQLYDEVEEEPWWLAEQLMRRAVKNEVQEIVMEAINSAEDDPMAALNLLREKTYQATEKVTPRHSRSDMSDYEERRQRYADPGQSWGSGIPFGLPELDYHTGGVRAGELVVAGAYSGVGKTFFLCQIAQHVRKAGFQPIIFTLEMSIKEIELRIDAFGSGVSYNRLERWTLRPQEKENLYAWQEELKGMGGILVEHPPHGQRTVSHLLSRAKMTGSNIVLIDQLSHMEATQKHRSEKERKAEILFSLDNELDNVELPCILAAQLNRESLDASELMMKHFADAAEVERHADFCLGFIRNRELRTNRLAQMEVLKGRRSSDAAWYLKWDLEDKTLIEEYERLER